MAPLEQPVDLGVRSDALEQVRWPPKAVPVQRFTQAIICVTDVQKGRGREREEGTGGRDDREFSAAAADALAAREFHPSFSAAMELRRHRCKHSQVG